MQDSADEWHANGPPEVSDDYTVLKQWERLRFVYNAILIPWTVLVIVMTPRRVASSEIWSAVVMFGVIANVFFCLGPVLETYLVWLGASPRTARRWLFGLGTAFTGLAATITVMVFGEFPSIND
jgi:hypothetical protein